MSTTTCWIRLPAAVAARVEAGDEGCGEGAGEAGRAGAASGILSVVEPPSSLAPWIATSRKDAIVPPGAQAPVHVESGESTSLLPSSACFSRSRTQRGRQWPYSLQNSTKYSSARRWSPCTTREFSSLLAVELAE